MAGGEFERVVNLFGQPIVGKMRGEPYLAGSPMPSRNHVHKYRRHQRGPWNKARFSCADQDCYKVARPGLLLGKLSRCWKCDQVFTLTYDNLETTKPLCLNCSNSKEAREYRRLNELALEMSGEVELLKEVEGKEIEEPII